MSSSKQASSVTIAFVGPYRWYPELEFNGSLVTKGYEQLNITFMSDMKNWGLKSWWFWNQMGAQFAIENINRNPNILPNTTIKIKRFNDHCKRGDCGGSAMTTAKEIHENHPDVIAVFGDFFGRTVKSSAGVYSQFQLPFCCGSAAVNALLDKTRYPFYIQTITISGWGKALFRLLDFWNVKRVAIISDQAQRKL
ncbi:periplasmic binding protein-like I [Obelidium mucronatum]|nr:periplasmic binding protein-like I [Obelidium mucronatum]